MVFHSIPEARKHFQLCDIRYLHRLGLLPVVGRAVDVTTSDRDRAKYGVLARLAVEAGFDWVYYESRGHIHLSVKSGNNLLSTFSKCNFSFEIKLFPQMTKQDHTEDPSCGARNFMKVHVLIQRNQCHSCRAFSDSSMAIYTGGCFPPTSLAQLHTGVSVTMAELTVGDHVLTMDADGRLEYSEVLMFLDRDWSTRVAYFSLHTDNGRNISLTPSHLIYAGNSRDVNARPERPVFAKDVVSGQYVFTVNSDSHEVQVSQVTRVEVRTESGYVAPLTKHGTIVVDDVVASCYARVKSQTIAHAAFWPVRALRDFSQLHWWSWKVEDKQEALETNHTYPTSWHPFATSNLDGGVHWYAQVLQNIAHYVIPESQWFYL